MYSSTTIRAVPSNRLRKTRAIRSTCDWKGVAPTETADGRVASLRPQQSPTQQCHLSDRLPQCRLRRSNTTSNLCRNVTWAQGRNDLERIHCSSLFITRVDHLHSGGSSSLGQSPLCDLLLPLLDERPIDGASSEIGQVQVTSQPL